MRDSDRRFRAGVTVGALPAMLAYTAIFSCALAGFAGVPPYAVAVCAIALASISYSENFDLYKRGRELGLSRAFNIALLRSLANGLLAAAAAYIGGRAFNWL
jgi:hypothetical protein